MRLILPLVLLLASGLAQPDSIWPRLRSRYLALKTLSGDFTESIFTGADGTVIRFSGRFAIRMPGSYRLEVTSPEKQLIVCSDSFVWFHFPAEKRAVRQPAGGSIPLLAFMAPILDTTATVRARREPSGNWLLEVSTADPTGLADLRLELDPRATRIIGFSFSDDWGARYRFSLLNQRWNPTIPAKTFRFTPPPGTQVEFQ